MMGQDLSRYRFGYSEDVHNLTLHSSRPDVRRIVRDRARQALAGALAFERITETTRDYSTEFRVEVLVFSPDEFYKIVQEEAMRLCRWMQPMNVTPMEAGR